MSRDIPLRSAENLIRASGSERVGEDAKQELIDRIEKITATLGHEAALNAMRSGRKTIQEEDIGAAIARLSR